MSSPRVGGPNATPIRRSQRGTSWRPPEKRAGGSGPTEAINGRLEHLRGSGLGFRNLTNYIARSLLEPGRLQTPTTPSNVMSHIRVTAESLCPSWPRQVAVGTTTPQMLYALDRATEVAPTELRKRRKETSIEDPVQALAILNETLS